ncbi:MAG: hypothetical protein ACREPM_03320 [Gemmatimonadaceae bacterium]
MTPYVGMPVARKYLPSVAPVTMNGITGMLPHIFVVTDVIADISSGFTALGGAPRGPVRCWSPRKVIFTAVSPTIRSSVDFTASYVVVGSARQFVRRIELRRGSFDSVADALASFGFATIAFIAAATSGRGSTVAVFAKYSRLTSLSTTGNV